jgi:hypothetical protein
MCECALSREARPPLIFEKLSDMVFHEVDPHQKMVYGATPIVHDEPQASVDLGPQACSTPRVSASANTATSRDAFARGAINFERLRQALSRASRAA